MTHKRWYDEVPELSEAVTTLFEMPGPLQRLMVKEIRSFTDQMLQDEQGQKKLRSVGAENVQALYKSKRRLRDYDKNPDMHNMMNGLMMLPRDQMTMVGGRLNFAIQEMDRLLKRGISVHELPRAVQRLLREGPVEGPALPAPEEKFLKQLPAYNPPFSDEEIQETEGGMHLSRRQNPSEEPD